MVQNNDSIPILQKKLKRIPIQLIGRTHTRNRQSILQSVKRNIVENDGYQIQEK